MAAPYKHAGQDAEALTLDAWPVHILLVSPMHLSTTTHLLLLVQDYWEADPAAGKNVGWGVERVAAWSWLLASNISELQYQ